MKHITIKDIAKKLNFSFSTISRAFNDKYDIKTETRELILKTAKEMGYHPNPIARKLIKQCSFNIGMVVPEFVNSFFPEVIIGAQEVLVKNGYQVIVMQSNESSEMECKNIETLVDNMVDGIIISVSSETKNKNLFMNLVESKLPVVFFNRVFEGIPASMVLFEDYKWSFFATEHLIRQGYRDIALLTGSRELLLTQNRIKGYKDAHRKYKITCKEPVESGLSMDDGRKIAAQMIKNKSVPEAIFASGDPCAIGAMQMFKKNGFSIPNDVAIVGFSESKLAPHVDPPLTSVEQPTFDMGKVAAELLLEQINNKGLFVPQSIVLNGKLNIRESSVKI